MCIETNYTALYRKMSNNIFCGAPSIVEECFFFTPYSNLQNL